MQSITQCISYGTYSVYGTTLQWRHNGSDSVSNHQPHDCLLNHLFRRRSKKTSKLRVTGLCAGNSPVTGEFPAQMASNAANVSIWWRRQNILWVIVATLLYGTQVCFINRHFPKNKTYIACDVYHFPAGRSRSTHLHQQQCSAIILWLASIVSHLHLFWH